MINAKNEHEMSREKHTTHQLCACILSPSVLPDVRKELDAYSCWERFSKDQLTHSEVALNQPGSVASRMNE